MRLVRFEGTQVCFQRIDAKAQAVVDFAHLRLK